MGVVGDSVGGVVAAAACTLACTMAQVCSGCAAGGAACAAMPRIGSIAGDRGRTIPMKQVRLPGFVWLLGSVVLIGLMAIDGDVGKRTSGNSSTMPKPCRSIASEPPAPAAMANSAVPEANAASGAPLRKHHVCIMCEKPKAKILAEAPDTEVWRLKARSCQTEDFKVVAHGGTIQVIVCSDKCRDEVQAILDDFRLQKALCGSMELAAMGTPAGSEAQFGLDLKRAMAESMTSPDHSETPGPAAMAPPAGSETQFDLDLKRAIAESMKSPDHSETPAPAAMATPAAPEAADAASGAMGARLDDVKPERELHTEFDSCRVAAQGGTTDASAPASAAAPAASAALTARPSTNEVHRGQNMMEHYSDIHRIEYPEDWRHLPAYVFKGYVSSEGDLTPPSLSGASYQESSSAASPGMQNAAEQLKARAIFYDFAEAGHYETEAVEAQAAEGDDSPPAASGAPSSSNSCCAPSSSPSSPAPSFVRDPDDGDDREDLCDFWRKGPGRFWRRPS